MGDTSFSWIRDIALSFETVVCDKSNGKPTKKVDIMVEAIFVNRSVQYHKDMKYHVMDNDTNYSAKSVGLLVGMMNSDGALFESSNDSFTVTFLENRAIIGTGIILESGNFRVVLKNGTIEDYDILKSA